MSVTESPASAPRVDDAALAQAKALAPLVSAEDAADRVAAGALFIDVRSAAGRASAGTIPGAEIVEKSDVKTRFGIESGVAVPGLISLDTPIVVVCGSPLGSGPVAAELIAQGFTNVSQVDGGFPAWRDAGLPTAPSQP